MLYLEDYLESKFKMRTQKENMPNAKRVLRQNMTSEALKIKCKQTVKLRLN